jgi:hypothetical protein
VFRYDLDLTRTAPCVRIFGSIVWYPVFLRHEIPRHGPFPLHFYYCFTFTRFIYILANYYLLPLDTLNLCLQQTGEIDNLTISWDKVLGCVVCRFHIVAGEKLHADKLSGTIVRSVAKLAGIHLQKFGSFSYWFDKPWFHN